MITKKKTFFKFVKKNTKNKKQKKPQRAVVLPKDKQRLSIFA